MKYLQYALALFSLIIILNSCSTRQPNPAITTDFTLKYLPKDTTQISANILLCRNYSAKNEEIQFPGIAFPTNANEKVYAIIEIENYKPIQDSQLFHIQWIDNEQNKLYTKQITQIPGDSVHNLFSAINTDNRTPGKYKIQIYHFRELIAEKYFHIIPHQQYIDSLLKELNPRVALSNNKYSSNKNNDSVFHIGAKNRIYSTITFKNIPNIITSDANLTIEWCTSDGNCFYKKTFQPKSSDSIYTLTSSISTTSKNRTEGKYCVNYYLGDFLLSQQSFTILPEIKLNKKESGKHLIKNIITLHQDTSTISLQNDNKEGSFLIDKKNRIYATVDISEIKLNKNDKLTLVWIDSNGKKIFSKDLKYQDVQPNKTVSSSISSEPKKRSPGIYSIHLYKNKNLISRAKFALIK